MVIQWNHRVPFGPIFFKCILLPFSCEVQYIETYPHRTRVHTHFHDASLRPLSHCDVIWLKYICISIYLYICFWHDRKSWGWYSYSSWHELIWDQKAWKLSRSSKNLENYFSLKCKILFQLLRSQTFLQCRTAVFFLCFLMMAFGALRSPCIIAWCRPSRSPALGLWSSADMRPAAAATLDGPPDHRRVARFRGSWDGNHANTGWECLVSVGVRNIAPRLLFLKRCFFDGADALHVFNRIPFGPVLEPQGIQ